MLHPYGQQRDGDPQQAVKPELLEDARVHHGGRRRRGGVGGRSPGVEREQRDQDAETHQQDGKNPALRGIADRSEQRDLGEVKRAVQRRKADVQADQSDEQDDAPDREINRDLPGGSLAVFAVAPDADQQKGGDQRQLVERVEEKQVKRDERADGSRRDEQEATVKRVFALFDFGCYPDGAERHHRSQQQHHQAQPVEADEEFEIHRRNDLEERVSKFVAEKRALHQHEHEVERRRRQRRTARRCAQQNGNRRYQGNEQEERHDALAHRHDGNFVGGHHFVLKPNGEKQQQDADAKQENVGLQIAHLEEAQNEPAAPGRSAQPAHEQPVDDPAVEERAGTGQRVLGDADQRGVEFVRNRTCVLASRYGSGRASCHGTVRTREERRARTH